MDFLPVVRVKNKFALPADELKGGYRDLMLSVLYEGQHGLRIIGEIQVLDIHRGDYTECPVGVCIHRNLMLGTLTCFPARSRLTHVRTQQ